MKTVMIVDDEKDIRDSVKTILEKEGYNVVTAVDGDDALKKVKVAKPDLVLLDIMMPGTPVKDIVPKLRTKVIYLSVVKISDLEKGELLGKNVCEFADLEKGELLGKNVCEFVEKPFDIKNLVSEVKKCLG